ncbi:MAG: hypothetical protein R3D03_07540 [Geminicoccaceae bacterium]
MHYYPQALAAILQHFDESVDDAREDLPQKVRDVILYGSGDDPVPMELSTGCGRSSTSTSRFEGVINTPAALARDREATGCARSWAAADVGGSLRQPRHAPQARGAACRRAAHFRNHRTFHPRCR